MEHPLLTVQHLTTTFPTERAPLRAVDDLSLWIRRAQSVGLVGESGCGKTMTAMSILRLVPSPGRIEATELSLDGTDLLGLNQAQMRQVRGNRVSMIFQDPMTSLNPVYSIGAQLAVVFRLHQGLVCRDAHEQAIQALEMVKIPDPRDVAERYPHELSGGMRQRVMIAMALGCRPQLLIADEPTTALDVTIQAQILNLMSELRRELGTAILLITHDLGVVAEFCEVVHVMYAGRIIEEAGVRDVFEDPRHPYTAGLLRSIPRLGSKVERLTTIDGSVPDLCDLPVGCRFQERCRHKMERCLIEDPPLEAIGNERRVACWLNDGQGL